MAAAPSAPSPRPRGIRVRTDYTSEDDFIAAFHDLCEDTMIFAPTEKMKPVGADCAFSLELADGTPMVRGLGVIKNVWATADSPFARPGIHIEIDQLTNTSEPIYNRLLAAREAAAHKPRTRPAPSTHQLWGKSSGPPTEEMDAVPEMDPEIEALPQRITREIRGVADLTDEAQPEEEGETRRAARAYARPPTLPGSVPPAPIPRPRIASAPMIPMPTGNTAPPPLGAAANDLGNDLAASRPRAWWRNARVGAVFAGGVVLGLVMSLAFRSSGDSKRVTPVAAAPQVTVKTELASCPPPPEPTAVAAAAPEPAPVVTTKARPAAIAASKPAAVKAVPPTKATKSAEVATATPKPATKPVTSGAPAPTRPAAKVAAKPKAAKPVCSSLDCI